MESDLTVAVITKIEELVKKGEEKGNRVIQIGGKDFDTKSLTRIIDNPRPKTLTVSSLSAISTYVKEKLEGLDPSGVFIRVVGPAQVELLEAFSGDEKIRTEYLRASLDNDAQPFRFNTFMSSEAFIIGAMSLFEETEDRVKAISFASGLVSEAKLTKTDSGGTTKTQAHQGVVNLSGEAEPGVIVLKPFRTFRQIAQPQSAFIFRYRANGDEIEVALFEADGGAWKHEAMENIAKFFATEVPDLKVLA
jgi:hypothetical protein